MRYLEFCRQIARLTLGLVLVSGSLAYGHGDSPHDSEGTGSYESDRSTGSRDPYDSYDPASYESDRSTRTPDPYDSSDPAPYERDRSVHPRDPYGPYDPAPYESGRPARSRDPYDPYDPALQTPPSQRAPQPSAGYGTPFGINKSTAGAVAGALLGAGSGAIIGSHRGKAGPGAAIGAGIGAVGGYAVGRQLETQDQALDEQDQLIAQQRQEIARNRALLEELKRRKLDARETDRGVVVTLPNVLFEFNQARLTPEAQAKVAHIATALKNQGKDRQVSVEGHADAIGSEAYNLALSQHRAEAVAQELNSDGVKEARLTTHGYGKQYPVAPNTNSDGSDNPAGRAKNRRVEVVIAN